jgi:hypothetical protein
VSAGCNPGQDEDLMQTGRLIKCRTSLPFSHGAALPHASFSAGTTDSGLAISPFVHLPKEESWQKTEGKSFIRALQEPIGALWSDWLAAGISLI